MLARLPTGCPSLDELLGGGVEAGALTLVYGEPGSGKTSLALQLSREVLASGGKSVLFIDTEGLSAERLEQVCGGEAPDGLSIAAPVDQAELLELLKSRDNPPALLIIDTVNAYARLEYAIDKEKCERVFTLMMIGLHNLATRHDLPGRSTSAMVKSVPTTASRWSTWPRRCSTWKRRTRPDCGTRASRSTAHCPKASPISC
ncbi:MAG: hypothetical protein CXT74_02710 [Methanobacteriota archaeon]|nr:MAG: hypothetical protein CXT74_02710 [Euryarchaeota archaeon]